MNFDNIKPHIYAFLIGLLSVTAMTALQAALGYIGAHIPDAISTLTQVAAGYGGTKVYIG